MNELTAVEQQFIETMRAKADPAGRVENLFRLALQMGVDYKHLHHRLPVLEALGYVKVERQGAPRPLVMWLKV